MPNKKTTFIIPTLNEEKHIEKTLETVEKQETKLETEIIIVDGGSTDQTIQIAEQHGVKIIKNIKGRGKARHKGAQKAEGEYLAFIDADTQIKPEYTEKMVEYVENNNLVAASSKFKMEGIRPKLIQAIGNTLFHRKRKPLLPGFNTFVKKQYYDNETRFENVMGEDLQFSNKITRKGKTGITKDKLVTTSGRRVTKMGLTGILIYYGIKDIARRINNTTNIKLWTPSQKPL